VTERSGSVAFIGWTNVGKSSLFNRLVDYELAAVGSAAQTTRQRLVGVVTRPERGQLALLDTPGLHDPRHRMNQAMVQIARRTVAEADVALLVVDASRPPGPGDRRALELVLSAAERRVCALNKIDLVRPRPLLLPRIAELAQHGLRDIVPVSARTGEGADTLLELLFQHVPLAVPAYPADCLTDQPERALVAEWIREKLLDGLRQELPHATAVVVDHWIDDGQRRLEIAASILVERDSQKKIVIGRQGSRIRDVGTAARRAIEERLGRPLVLHLIVRTSRDWRDDERVLHDLGLDPR
jgi:GTP-binding protein Era